MPRVERVISSRRTPTSGFEDDAVYSVFADDGPHIGTVQLIARSDFLFRMEDGVFRPIHGREEGSTEIFTECERDGDEESVLGTEVAAPGESMSEVALRAWNRS